MKKLVVLFAGPMLAISLAACGAATEATDDAKQAVGEAKNAVAGDPLTTVEVLTSPGTDVSEDPYVITEEQAENAREYEAELEPNYPADYFSSPESGYPAEMTLEDFQCHEGLESVHLKFENKLTTIKGADVTFWFYNEPHADTRAPVLHFNMNSSLEVISIHYFGGSVPDGYMKTRYIPVNGIFTPETSTGKEIAQDVMIGSDAVICFKKN